MIFRAAIYGILKIKSFYANSMDNRKLSSQSTPALVVSTKTMLPVAVKVCLTEIYQSYIIQ